MKKATHIFLLVCITLIISISSLSAEEDSAITPYKTGLFVQNFVFAGESILTFENIYRTGAIVHVTPNIAVRPGVTFSFHSTNEEDVYGSGPEYKSEEEFFLGASIDALYFIDLGPGLTLYTGPGFGYTDRKSEDYDSTETITDKREYKYINAEALLGLQYMFNSSVALSMETGLIYRYVTEVDYDYTSGSITGEDNTIDTDIYLISPRIGLTIYFN